MDLRLITLYFGLLADTCARLMVPGEGCGTETRFVFLESVSESDLPLPGCTVVEDEESFQKVYLPFKGT